jgi:hypothetical protein
MANYLFSFKLEKDSKPVKQYSMKEHDALNFLRKLILNMQSMEETAATFRAMYILKECLRSPQMIQSPSNRFLVIQLDDNS